MGANRIVATVGESATSTRGAEMSLRSELDDILPTLVTKAATRAAIPRIAQLRAFLDALDAQAHGGTFS